MGILKSQNHFSLTLETGVLSIIQSETFLLPLPTALPILVHVSLPRTPNRSVTGMIPSSLPTSRYIQMKIHLGPQRVSSLTSLTLQVRRLRKGSSDKVGQHGTKIRPKTPVSQAAALHYCRGPCGLPTDTVTTCVSICRAPPDSRLLPHHSVVGWT